MVQTERMGVCVSLVKGQGSGVGEPCGTLLREGRAGCWRKEETLDGSLVNHSATDVTCILQLFIKELNLTLFHI